jgi:hypothetical protein
MFTREETNLFRSLSSPKKIQDFLNTLRPHLKNHRDTCWSPRRVLQKRIAHCEEVWEIPNELGDVKHVPILTHAQRATLRRADPIEIKAGWLRTY